MDIKRNIEPIHIIPIGCAGNLVTDCHGVGITDNVIANFKNGLFCAFIKNEENDYYIFNKKVSKEEFDNIKKILYTHFRKIFEEGANVKERDIVAFKKYCTMIPGYDYSLFEYLLESVFEYWVAELKNKSLGDW